MVDWHFPNKDVEDELMEGRPSTGELRARLEAFVQRIRHETGIPGIALAVSREGERCEAFAGSRDPADRVPLGSQARYHLGSATELLLAIVTLELATRGRIALDATLDEFLPELAGTVHGGSVRVAHLLAHTNGYRGTHLLDRRTRPDDWPGLIAYLREAPQLFKPGTVFSYEHTGAVLLGAIVRRVTGKDCLALIDEQIFAPLGIRPGRFSVRTAADAGRHRPDERTGRFRALDAAPLPGPLWLPAFSDYTLTLAELTAVAEVVTTGRTGPSVLLAPATLRALHSSVVHLPPTAGGPLRELLPIAFGQGTAELRDGSRGASGTTVGQCLGLKFWPTLGLTVVAAVNAAAPHLRDLVLAAVGRDLGDPPEPGNSVPFALDFAALEGTYFGPGTSVVTARRAGERLLCELGREHQPERLRVEVALDANGVAVLRSSVPQLALGFFVEPATGVTGLMVGLSAYRKGPIEPVRR